MHQLLEINLLSEIIPGDGAMKIGPQPTIGEGLFEDLLKQGSSVGNISREERRTNRSQKEGAASELLIGPGQIPQVGEILFKFGLPAEQVKALLEKGVDQDGRLPLSKLVRGLSKFFPQSEMEKVLPLILSRCGIQCEPREISQRIGDQNLNQLMELFSQTRSQGAQKKIKEMVGALLREKGVPPQEAKAFLETITLSHARAMSASNSLREKANPPSLGDGLFDRRQGGQERVPNGVIQGDPSKGRLQALRKTGPLQSVTSAITEGVHGKGTNRAEDGTEFVSLLKRGARLDAEEAKVREIGGKLKNHPNNRDPVSSLPETSLNTIKAEKRAGDSPVFTQSRDTSSLPEPLPRIVDRMAWMIQAGQQRGRIQLSPPELGRLDLRIVIEQGHLRVHLGTENLLAKEAIESNLSQLKQHLTELGFVVDEFHVGVGGDNRKWAEQDGLFAFGRQGQGRARQGAMGLENASKGRPSSMAGDGYRINLRV